MPSDSFRWRGIWRAIGAFIFAIRFFLAFIYLLDLESAAKSISFGSCVGRLFNYPAVAIVDSTGAMVGANVGVPSNSAQM